MHLLANVIIPKLIHYHLIKHPSQIPYFHHTHLVAMLYLECQTFSFIQQNWLAHNSIELTFHFAKDLIGTQHNDCKLPFHLSVLILQVTFSPSPFFKMTEHKYLNWLHFHTKFHLPKPSLCFFYKS